MRYRIRRYHMSISSGFVCFSPHARAILERQIDKKVYLVPLVSEYPDERAFRSKNERNGFLMLGRQASYKGTDLGIEAWSLLAPEIRASEKLTIFASDGPLQAINLENTEGNGITVIQGKYKFESLLPVLSTVRAVLLPYKNISQSGVQLLAMQNSVPTLISNIEGLAQFQPPSLDAINSFDAADWASAMSEIVLRNNSFELGRNARLHYESLAVEGEQVLRALEFALTDQMGLT
jgi:hypothetical protein